MFASKNFTQDELRCKCPCKKYFIVDEAIQALQDLRDLVDKPIQVLRGYSCVTHNMSIGGSQTSQHISGKAFDIHILGMTVKEMYEAAQKIPAFNQGGIGIYPKKNFIHVDTRVIPARWAQIPKKKVDTYVSIEEGLKYV